MKYYKSDTRSLHTSHLASQPTTSTTTSPSTHNSTMCRSPLHPFLARLPKCEHHIHIEGSLMPETLFALAKRNNIALPSSDPAYASPEALLARYSKFTSLDDFLHYYYLGMSTLLTEEDFYDLGMAYLEKAKGDGVVHAESK